MQTLYRDYYRLVEKTDSRFLRYLYGQINWDDRLIGIKGARGVGKTTLILQHIHRAFPEREKALYVSMDQLWFTQHSLLELVEYHYTHGGTHLFLDEVHRYPRWSIELKNAYDAYPDLHIVFTGSSLLEIDYSLADLSRRCRLYTLEGLSFREFLLFEGVAQWQPITLDRVLTHHMQEAARLTADVKVLPWFEKYLRTGYYPFYKESEDGYFPRLSQVINVVIENDIPAVEKMEYESLLKAKRLLVILAEMVPYTLNVSALCTTLQVSRNHLIKLLQLLQKARLIYQMFSPARGLKQLAKPSKVLFDNTNVMYALGNHTEIGTVRETFFANQLRFSHTLGMPDKGDFMVDGRYLFEVGGKGKGFAQIRNQEDSFVVADEIEIGMGNKIPLWMFGLLY
jgi:hypothetical protein